MDTNKETNFSQSQLLLTETIRRLLTDFRGELLSDISLLLANKRPTIEKTWLKSAEVKKLLGISHGTLQTMRNNRIIPFTKIGGVIYYSRAQIEQLLLQQSSPSSI